MSGVAASRWPVLALGFRPFFLLAAMQAALMVALWIPWFLGLTSLPVALPPRAWHAHELLFGFVPAVVAGFLLTAIPTWTGRAPVTGAALAVLAGLWLIGRIAVAVSGFVHPVVTAALALVFPVVLFGVAGHAIVAARSWRNSGVVALLGALCAALALLHYELWRFGMPIHATRLGVAAVLVLIMVIAGRITPLFTGNWLRAANPGREPVPPGAFDRAAVALGVLALGAWVLAGGRPVEWSGLSALLFVTGAVHLLRLARWVPWRTGAEPLVAVLHLAYAFIPAGFVLAALDVRSGGAMTSGAAMHAWTVGAIGLMTLGVMTRVSRGHTGRALTAPPATAVLYALVAIAALARVSAALVPAHTLVLAPTAGLAWSGAFVGFLFLYGPMLLAPRAGD